MEERGAGCSVLLSCMLYKARPRCIPMIGQLPLTILKGKISYAPYVRRVVDSVARSLGIQGVPWRTCTPLGGALEFQALQVIDKATAHRGIT